MKTLNNKQLSMSLLLANSYLPFGESLLEHAKHCDNCIFCSEYRDLVDDVNLIIECSPKRYLSDRVMEIVDAGDDAVKQFLDEDMYLYLKSKDCSDVAIAKFFGISYQKLEAIKTAIFNDEDAQGNCVSSFKEFADDYIAIFQKFKLSKFLIQKSEYLVI